MDLQLQRPKGLTTSQKQALASLLSVSENAQRTEQLSPTSELSDRAIPGIQTKYNQAANASKILSSLIPSAAAAAAACPEPIQLEPQRQERLAHNPRALAATQQSTSAQIFRTIESQCLFTAGKDDSITSISICDNGEAALVASKKNALLFDLSNTSNDPRTTYPSEKLSRQGHQKHATASCFSQDGQALLIGTSEGRVELWLLLPKAKPLFCDLSDKEKHAQAVISISVAGNRSQVLSISADNSILLYPGACLTEGWRLLRPYNLEKHSSRATASFISEDGKYAITVSNRSAIWRELGGIKINTSVSMEGEVTTTVEQQHGYILSRCPAVGRYMYTSLYHAIAIDKKLMEAQEEFRKAEKSTLLKIKEKASPKPPMVEQAPQRCGLIAACSCDGLKVATAEDHTATLWIILDIKSYELIEVASTITAIAMGKESVLIGTSNGRVLFFDISNPECIATYEILQLKAAITHIAIAENAGWAVIATEGSLSTPSQLKLFDLRTFDNPVIYSLIGHTQAINQIALSKARILLAKSTDESVRLYRLPRRVPRTAPKKSSADNSSTDSLIRAAASTSP